jgi:hypothetical protein
MSIALPEVAAAPPTAETTPTVADSLSGRRILVWAGALIAIYLVAHLALLGRFPWFIDETIFATYAQGVASDPAQRFVALIDHKGLVNSWFGGLLIHLGISPIAAMRLLSIGSGLVVAGATAAVVRIWRSPREALIVGGVTLFVPYLFVHASVGIYDEFIAAGSMVALALQLSLARRQRLDIALILGITYGLLLLSKPTGAIAIALAPLSLAVFDWRRAGLGRRLSVWVGFTLLGLMIAAALYLLTRLSPLAYTPAPDNHRTLSDLIHDPFANLRAIAPWAAKAYLGYLTLPGVALAAWGSWRVIVRREAVGLVLIVWAVAATIAFLLLTDHAYPRYGLQAAAPLCALAVFGAADLWDRIQRRWSRNVALVVTVLAALPLIWLDLRVVISPGDAPYPGLDRRQYVTLVSNREPARQAAQEILRRAPAHPDPAAPPSEYTVADLFAWTEATTLTLNASPSPVGHVFSTIDQNAGPEAVNAARYVILEDDAPDWLDQRSGTRVRTWPRPGGGPPVVLFDRGPRPVPATPAGR